MTADGAVAAGTVNATGPTQQDCDGLQDDALNRQKAAMRATAAAARDALTRATDLAVAAETAARLFCETIERPTGTAVSAYWPMGSELDPRPLLERLHGEGLTLLLPVTRGRHRPLLFRRWRPGEPLVPGGFGTSVPPETAAEGRPDILLVPLLAFDARGYRLGYGGGYYDRTLRALRNANPALTAVGYAFAAQMVERVPHHGGDERLDWMVTERGATRFSRASAS